VTNQVYSDKNVTGTPLFTKIICIMKNLNLFFAPLLLNLYCFKSIAVLIIHSSLKWTINTMIILLLIQTKIYAQEPPPCDAQADFEFTGGGCSAVSFVPDITTGTHSWNFGDGSTISTSVSPSHLYVLNTVPWVVTHTVTIGGVTYTCTKIIESYCSSFSCPGSSEEDQRGIRLSAVDCEFSFDFTTSLSSTITSWDFGDGNTAGNVNPAVHTYAASGLYTVTVYYTLGGVNYECAFDVMAICPCSSEFSSSVSYDPCLGLEVAFENDCDEDILFHVWDFGDGCSIAGNSGDVVNNVDVGCITWGTNEAPVHVYNVNTYTGQNTDVDVTHTLFPTGDPQSTMTNIDLEAALPTGIDGIYIGYVGEETNLTNLIAANVMPPGTIASIASLSGQDVYIHGSLVVDVTYRFDDCNLRMAGGAAIEVQNNRTLRIWDDSEVSANDCACLWRWIRTEGGSTTDVRESALRDALFTFYPVESSALHLRENFLQNNFIGIYYDEQNTGSGANNFDFNAFRGNIIETTGTLLPICDIEEEITGRDLLPNTTYSTTIGFSGMFFRNSLNQNIPEYTSAANNYTLRDLANGIRLQDGDLNIRSCIFENILNNTSYAGDGGFGVFFITGVAGNTLTQRGISHFSGQNTFLNCSTAMYAGTFAEQTEVVSWDNNIDYNLTNMDFTGYTLIAETGGRFENTEISDNDDIHINDVGIEVFNNNSSIGSDIFIHDNMIENEPAGGSCISLSGNGMAANDADIAFNTLNMNNCLRGINLLNWIDDQDVDVTENTINLNNIESNSSQAIRVEGCSDVVLSCNHILGEYATGNGDNALGIFAITSPECDYIQNDITDVRSGLTFDGDCDPSDVRRNAFQGAMNIGLEYTNNSLTNTNLQVDKGNEWTGAFDSWGARHNSSSNPLILLSRYLMPIIETPLWSTGGTAIWFDVGNDNNEDNCEMMMMMMSSSEFGEIDEDIANGNTSEMPYTETEQRLVQEALYRRIIQQNTDMSSPLPSDALLDFASQMSDQPIGQLNAIHHDFAAMLSLAKAPYEAEIAELYVGIQNLRRQLNEIDSIFALEIEGYSFDKAPLLEELYQKTSFLREIYLQISTSITNSLLEIESLNSTIVSQNIIDDNDVRMNSILFAYLLSDSHTYSDEDWEFIQAMAMSCPNNDGNKTFLAKALYHSETGVVPESPCLAEDRGADSAHFYTNNTPGLILHPNPVSSSINLVYPVQNESDFVSFNISDLIGGSLKTGILPYTGVNVEIDCNDLPSGMYLMTLKVNNISILTKKFIKI
jgi:hypothetical protein